MPKMYEELAPWWPLLSAPEDYEEEATFYARALQEACRGPMRTVLELGSGGGNNASFFKRQYAMTLVEPSAGMLEVSQRLNPECEHIIGDMRTVRLEREFDAVFVHDAVAYMASESDLRKAIETAAMHCRRGGAVLFAPDFLRETFRPTTDHGGHDGETRALRFLEWVTDPDPDDTCYQVDYIIALRTPDGAVRMEHDRHVEGLFSRGEWLRWLTEAGLQPRSIPFDHSELEPGTYEVFVATKPS